MSFFRKYWCFCHNTKQKKENLNFGDFLGCPSNPNFNSKQLSVSGKKNVRLFGVMSKTSASSGKNVPWLLMDCSQVFDHIQVVFQLCCILGQGIGLFHLLQGISYHYHIFKSRSPKCTKEGADGGNVLKLELEIRCQTLKRNWVLIRQLCHLATETAFYS